MEFTPKQRAYIDWKLKLADEIQERKGNKLYPFEETFDRIFKDYIKEEDNYRV